MAFPSQDLRQPEERYGNFVLTRSLDIEELQCTLRELVHTPSGAHILHIEADDDENLFCLSFQTLPQTSNGVAHILEHVTLCGSEKFPVDDPFFAMGRRSLNTYMNALTGSDFTCYPAATQVPKDFYNLLDVYLDAVFKPNLSLYSFLQEGHRLEFEVPDDPSTPLKYKGVVFNEMKGSMASPDTRLWRTMTQALFPDTTYGVNSGGDPKAITSLTYQELLTFHRKFYHPSRCLFFFYGNLPLQQHLDFLEERALGEVQAQAPLPPIPQQQRFKTPLHLVDHYPLTPGQNPEDRSMVSFGWLTCSVLEQQELLALCVLDVALMGTDASPLKRALLESGLCKQVSSYIDIDIAEIPYVLILKGCKAEDADAIEHLVLETLRHIAAAGIPQHLIEAALHQLELDRSEITGDSTPFGLSLFMRAALIKQHGGPPESGLRTHALFDKLRPKMQKDRYLSELLEKHFLHNSHRVRLCLIGDPHLTAREEQEERQALDAIQATLTDKQKVDLVEQSRALAAYKDSHDEEDPDLLPKLSLADVPQALHDFPLKHETYQDLNIFHHECFTNSLVYADLVFDLPYIAEDDLPYVRLFTVLFDELGTKKRDYRNNLEYLLEHTGGVSASLSLNVQAADCHQFFPYLCISGKALHYKADKLFAILIEMIEGVDVTDKPRIRDLLVQHYSSLSHSLHQQALRYATNLSASRLSISSRVANEWYGLNYYATIKKIAKNLDQELPNVLERLVRLKEDLLCLGRAQLVLSCQKNTFDALKKAKFYGLAAPATEPCSPWEGNYPLHLAIPQGRLISSPVAFTAQVFNTIPYIHPASPALGIASHLLDNKVLHARIREQGGAYGGGAVSNATSGNFYFYAYRDPHLASTVQAFEDSLAHIARGSFSEADLEEAKLSMIQHFDAPVAPGSRASTSYSWWRSGKTHARRMAFRHGLLSTTKEQVQQAVLDHLLEGLASSSLVTFASQDFLEKENAAFVRQGKPPLPIFDI